MGIDWKRKLTSRKFWLAIASFVSMMLVALGGTEAEAAQVTALIMAGATVVGYVIGEGLADAGHSTDVTPAIMVGELIASENSETTEDKNN